MKKITLLAAAALMPLMLSACATGDAGAVANTAGTTAGNIGMAIFTQAVDTRCRSELNNQPIYQTASMVMTAQQKQAFEERTCGCVAQKAPQNVTLEELTTAAIDQNARAGIVLKAVNKSLTTCASEYLNTLAR